KRLRAKEGAATARVDGRLLRLDELQKEVERAQGVPPSENVWPMYRGDCSRTAQAQGRLPLLDPNWVLNTLPRKQEQRDWGEAEIKHASSLPGVHKEPLLPAFFPIIADGKVLYRTCDGVYASSLTKGLFAWYSHTDGGLDGLLSDPNKKAYLDQWNTRYRDHG